MSKRARSTKLRALSYYVIPLNMNTLTVCLIVKNEEEVLSRCLDCVKSFADEIIIVDTGSEDCTVSIAQKYTDKVYFFKWCEDFSAARNFSFEKATCDFVMWLDADDVITDENATKISELKDRNDFDVAMLKYAAAFDGCGNPTFVYYRERIFRRLLNLQWQGAVHEVIEPCGRIIHSDACIFHKKCKSASPMRNLRIYQKQIAEGKPLTPRGQFYYGRELYFNNMLTECVAVLTDFLRSEGWSENKVEACRTLYHALRRLGREEQALKTLACGFLFSFPHAEDCCILAEHFESQNDYRCAIYWYERALASPEREEDGGFVNVDYRGYFPAIRLCVLYDKLGYTQTAYKFNELAGSFKPNDASYQFNVNYFKSKGVDG